VDIFPATGILDSFTGANEDPITTNWTTPVFTGGANLTRNTNRIGGRGEEAYYDQASFGPDCEAYATIANVANVDGDIYEVFVRLSGEGGAGSGRTQYYLDLGLSGAVWSFRLGKVVLGSLTGLTVVTVTGPTAGDKIGLRVMSNRLEAWYYQSGVWNLITTVFDGSIGTAGRIGVAFANSGLYLDDFGGGTFTASSANDPPVGTLGRGAGW